MRICLFCLDYLNTASRIYIFLWGNNIHSLHYICIYTHRMRPGLTYVYTSKSTYFFTIYTPPDTVCQDITKVKWITLTVPISTPKPSNLQHSVSVSLIFQCCDFGVEVGHYRMPASWREMANWFCDLWAFRLIGCYLLAQKKPRQRAALYLLLLNFPPVWQWISHPPPVLLW